MFSMSRSNMREPVPPTWQRLPLPRFAAVSKKLSLHDWLKVKLSLLGTRPWNAWQSIVLPPGAQGWTRVVPGCPQSSAFQRLEGKCRTVKAGDILKFPPTQEVSCVEKVSTPIQKVRKATWVPPAFCEGEGPLSSVTASVVLAPGKDLKMKRPLTHHP